MNKRKLMVVRPSNVYRMMDDFFNTATGVFTDSLGLNQNSMGEVDLNMYETDQNVVVELKVPGYKKENINIKVEDNILTVEGSITADVEDESEKKYYVREITTESFTRSVSLPSKVKAEESEANFAHGMLTIKMPKLEEVKPKSITIKAD